MNTLVDFEVFRSCKDFAASGERARKRLLARVDPDVVDQLVLGLEGLALARTAVPKASMVGNLGSANVLHSDVGHYFVHRRKEFATRLS